MPPKGKSKLTDLVAGPYDPLYSAINIKLKGYNGPKAYTLRAQPKNEVAKNQIQIQRMTWQVSQKLEKEINPKPLIIVNTMTQVF